MISKRVKLTTLLLLLILKLDIALAAESPVHEASGLEALIPTPGMAFQDYVESNTSRIREVLARDYFAVQDEPFGPGYALEDAVAMRAPYELLPDDTACATQGQRVGFLLIHGLTDSPYLLHDVAESLRGRYPCALLRGLLLPGHGTVPGDTLDMQYEDWIRTTEYGVESFRGEVDALYMVGFSTGTSLSVQFVDAHRDDELVKGLIMLSPAIKARSGIAFLSPYVRWFSDWLSENAEHDAARYESFSMNAGAEFYELTKTMSRADFQALDVPVFMAASDADSTVNTEAAREFFCTKTPARQRQMLWYQSKAEALSPEQLCEGVLVVPAASAAHRVVNLAHTSITMSPENLHYGLDGDYSMCLHYSIDSADYTQCVQDDDQTVYAESGLGENGRYEGKLIRRGSFNPHFAQMMEHINRFIEKNP